MSLREDGFWEEHYASELKSYEEDGCESDVWFGKGLNKRVASWILEHLTKKPVDITPVKILDVGCGNAFTLISLVERLPESINNLDILGIDYSKSSVELSKKIVSNKGLSGRIQLKQCDFLHIDQVKAVSRGLRFDFIIDIGTYDAICLLAGSALMETKLNYMKSIDTLIRDGSIFILASCNHTEEELITLIGDEFKIIDRIESPKLTFGGREGSQVNCIVVRLNKHSDNMVA